MLTQTKLAHDSVKLDIKWYTMMIKLLFSILDMSFDIISEHITMI